jgi:hypothetical protein
MIFVSWECFPHLQDWLWTVRLWTQQTNFAHSNLDGLSSKTVRKSLHTCGILTLSSYLLEQKTLPRALYYLSFVWVSSRLDLCFHRNFHKGTFIYSGWGGFNPPQASPGFNPLRYPSVPADVWNKRTGPKQESNSIVSCRRAIPMWRYQLHIHCFVALSAFDLLVVPRYWYQE